jgi:hypothetical protein
LRVPAGRITRRQILATAAAVPIVGALGAGTVGWRWWDRAPGEGLKALSQDEHDFVDAAAEAWMPPGGEPAISGAEARVGLFFDELVAAMSPASGRELKVLLQALDDLAIPGHLSTFRKLSLDTRTAVLTSWLHSDRWLVRLATTGVLVLISEGYTLHPQVASGLRPYFPCGFGA